MASRMLIINPGSTSTKIAFFTGKEKKAEEIIRHETSELVQFDNVAEQLEFRMFAINNWIESLELDQFDVIVGRGAPLRPLDGGSYKITEAMLEDLKTARYSNHASNLGAIIAHHLGERYGCLH